MGLLKRTTQRGPRLRRPIVWLSGSLLLGAVAIVSIVAWSSAQTPGPVELVSIGPDGRAGDAASSAPAINADGSLVAFFSDADDLIRGDTNEARDVFVRDRRNGRTERVSIGYTGKQADLPSHRFGDAPAINAVGDIVAFYSDATNLIANDHNDRSDVFVRLRGMQTTEIVSLSSGGVQGNDDSLNPSIDAVGRLVAFQSLATNLVPNDTNGVSDIFVRDRSSGHTERVCDHVQANNGSLSPAISADGNFVAFSSAATNLIDHDTNNVLDVFVCNRTTGQIDIVSVSTNGTLGNGDSILPAISADGRFVAFKSLASNLVPDDHNGVVDVFVRDRVAGTTERVSVSFLGRDANDASFPPGIDCSGRYVVFGSQANNIVLGDVNELASVFVRDRTLGLSFLVDVNARGEQANGAALDVAPAVSCDPPLIAYTSLATNLTSNDNNDNADVYIAGVPMPPCVCPPQDDCHEAAVCDPQSGLCVNPTKPDGTPCDTGNLCTRQNECHAGVCVGVPVDCSVADVCHDAGTCDPATGLCPNPRPNGTPCDDGNLCSTGDTCQDSLCVGTPKDCAVADACHDAGTCDPTTGLCPNPRPNGTPCDDGNLCSTGDMCEGSVCVGTTKDCSHADSCHDAGTCNPTTGLCPGPRPNGTPCDDGNLCSTGDMCEGSVCVGTAKDCSHADACHDAGTCNPTTGLCPNPRPNGNPCDDGNACSTGDSCQGSVCVGTPKDCSHADACHDAGACNPTTGQCPNPRPNGTPCDDGNLCSNGDTCEGSVCVGQPKDCSHADACHDAGACNPTTGLCPNPRPNGSSCDDGNACSTGDACQGSVCVGTPKDCSQADTCHDAGTCNPVTGLCTGSRPDGTPCSDGNLCSTGDACHGGICTGTVTDCSHADACHDAGTCNPATGQCPNARPNGTPCSDGNLCSTGDACQGGLCTGTPIDCSQANACHGAGACNPATGLCPGTQPDGTPCSDGNLCSTGDACHAGVCSGTATDCSHADACHDAGVCNPATGQCPNPRPNGTACSDGSLCTTGDACQGGLCTGTPTDCSQANACHGAGACNPATGLCPGTQPDGTPCSDGNLCSTGDACHAGVCSGTAIDCSHADACHDAGVCNPATGQCPNPRPNGTPCDDGNLCSTADACHGGVCTGTPRDCSQANGCHDAGACNPATGQCPNTLPDGTSCSSGDLCAINEMCHDGDCSGAVKDCSHADACHDAGMCEPTTGLCPNPRPDGTPCDDGKFCTSTDTCDGSICVGTNSPCPSGQTCDEATRQCVAQLDQDACHCSLDPNAPRTRTAGWIWVSAAVALLVRRQRRTAA